MAVAAVIVADLAWLATPFVSLSDDSWPRLALILLSAIGLSTLAHLAPLPPRIYTLITGFAISLSLWPALKMLNHITMSVPLPLADTNLARADAILGFDWLSYMLWLDQYPSLIRLMSLTYGLLSDYCAITFLLLLLLKGHERAMELVCLFVMSAVFTILVGPLAPAQGAMIFYAPDPGQFAVVNSAMGTYFWAPLEAIRGRSELELVLAHLPGLVAFPSFHTVMGVILIYVSRRVPFIFGPALAINLIMIASTPLFGGHYLVDVIAGVATATGTIILYNRFGKRTKIVTPPQPRRKIVSASTQAASDIQSLS
ncbi:membrane-associated phospholipid phosphatase [Sphingopyxis panaciterrae]|uniref:phosphatase PAP2 family protein n=1 Tax=Sphingopyxis panaciterrae TaxID=363841 RepID=UPI00141EC740|nr:phosphatase PAP2 family protein [Sphingopyxis panaciterrae]NIJ38002.1 membrane-associated phospholipid phosphatase [Sphingopyxis panaciterrae]